MLEITKKIIKFIFLVDAFSMHSVFTVFECRLSEFCSRYISSDSSRSFPLSPPKPPLLHSVAS